MSTTLEGTVALSDPATSRHESFGPAALNLAAGPFVPIWQPDGAPSDSPLGGQQEDLLCRCHTTA